MLLPIKNCKSFSKGGNMDIVANHSEYVQFYALSRQWFEMMHTGNKRMGKRLQLFSLNLVNAFKHLINTK